MNTWFSVLNSAAQHATGTADVEVAQLANSVTVDLAAAAAGDEAGHLADIPTQHDAAGTADGHPFPVSDSVADHDESGNKFTCLYSDIT
jgi:hypothetical protein